jgi:hypothetical protein
VSDPTTIPATKIRIRYLGEGTRRVPLPVPFLSRHAHVGDVICDPIGIFPREDGQRLVALAPTMFAFVDGDDATDSEPLITTATTERLPARVPARRHRQKAVAKLVLDTHFPGCVLVQSPVDSFWEIHDARSFPSQTVDAASPPSQRAVR